MHWADSIFSKAALVSSAVIALAGCAVAPAAAPVRSNAPPPVSAPPPINTQGLSGIIGRTDSELVALFGPPRLDVMEGQARKLQFSGTNCVLDVYLYPPEKSGKSAQERKSTYADARDLQGAAVDRAACVKALRR